MNKCNATACWRISSQPVAEWGTLSLVPVGPVKVGLTWLTAEALNPNDTGVNHKLWAHPDLWDQNPRLSWVGVCTWETPLLLRQQICWQVQPLQLLRCLRPREVSQPGVCSTPAPCAWSIPTDFSLTASILFCVPNTSLLLYPVPSKAHLCWELSSPTL